MLRIADKAAVVDALIRCPALLSEADRGKIFAALPFAAEIVYDPAPLYHLSKAIDVCERAPYRLAALLDALLWVEGFSNEFQAACDVLQQFLRWTVPCRLVFELKDILDGVDIGEERVEAAWRATLPAAPIPAPDSEGGLLSLCLYQLADGLTSPLRAFVTGLLPDLGDKRPAIEAWLEKAALPAPAHPPAPTTSAPAPFLIIKVEKDVNTPDYHVTAWYSRPRPGLLRGLEEPFPRARLSEALAICWQETRRLLAGDAEAQQRLVVEAFLPLELLADATLEFERLLVKHGLGSHRRIGALAPVVLRSLERVYSPESRQDTWGDWREKWQRRPAPPSPFAGNTLYWVCSDSELKGDHFETLCQGPLVFIALTAVPPGPPGIDIIRQMIDAGTPIAMWRREPSPVPDAERTELSDLLCRRYSEELPRLVLGKRKTLPDEPLWHSLVLLWDDPDRLPPDLTN